VKIIRFDSGKEFDFIELYDKLGILHKRSSVGTLQQNSFAERKHQHILNKTHSLIFQYGLPKSYWSYAAAHAIYLINRLPSVVWKKKILLMNFCIKFPQLS